MLRAAKHLYRIIARMVNNDATEMLRYAQHDGRL